MSFDLYVHVVRYRLLKQWISMVYLLQRITMMDCIRSRKQRMYKSRTKVLSSQTSMRTLTPSLTLFLSSFPWMMLVWVPNQCYFSVLLDFRILTLFLGLKELSNVFLDFRFLTMLQFLYSVFSLFFQKAN